MSKKRSVSTFDRIMKDPLRKAKFEKSYKEFLLSELIISLMENDQKSVRQLAAEANISPTVIQSIRSGRQTDLKTSNFLNIIDKLGFQFELKRKDSSQIIKMSLEDNHIVAHQEEFSQTGA